MRRHSFHKGTLRKLLAQINDIQGTSCPEYEQCDSQQQDEDDRKTRRDDLSIWPNDQLRKGRIDQEVMTRK